MISEEVIRKFGQDVIERAMRNVGATYVVNGKRRRLDTTGRLRNSLRHEVREVVDGFMIDFTSSEEYAKFQEFGVDGVRKKYGSPFSFTNKQPPPKAMMDFIKRKRLKMRDPKTGQFVTPTEARKRSAAFLIGRSIYRFGIAPKHFLQDAILDTIEELPDELVDEMDRHIGQVLQRIINE